MGATNYTLTRAPVHNTKNQYHYTNYEQHSKSTIEKLTIQHQSRNRYRIPPGNTALKIAASETCKGPKMVITHTSTPTLLSARTQPQDIKTKHTYLDNVNFHKTNKQKHTFLEISAN
jgi:hypothetical protein